MPSNFFHFYYMRETWLKFKKSHYNKSKPHVLFMHGSTFIWCTWSCKPLKLQGCFGENQAWNMYLLTCGAMIKIKWCFSTSNSKILYLNMLIFCRKNLNQSDCIDCKIITNEGEEFFFGKVPELCQCFEIQ
jgi:hypothetical protein